jgi:hypothetical protein
MDHSFLCNKVPYVPSMLDAGNVCTFPRPIPAAMALSTLTPTQDRRGRFIGKPNRSRARSRTGDWGWRSEFAWGGGEQHDEDGSASEPYAKLTAAGSLAKN